MTDRTLPLLFLNLGGEMLYILEDRLKAQNVLPEKAKKVLHDIVAIMLNERFVEELFKPQELYNKQALRSLFENLAHVSIMRLNRASMNKLYDLMVMVVKYQLYSVLRPQDILLVTMNHLEALGSHPSACITKLIENYHTHFIKTYASMQSGELQTVRHCIINYFQDERVRVSVLLREGLQNPDGKFVMPISGAVPTGCEMPVIIRTFSSQGSLETQRSYPSQGNYQPCGEAGSLGLNRKHQTVLGLNIYNPTFANTHGNRQEASSDADLFKAELLPGLQGGSGESSVGCEELKLLARLLGPGSLPRGSQELQLDLFLNSQEEEAYVQQRMSAGGCPALMIDARTQGQTQELAAVFREMSVASSIFTDSSEDLLHLIENP